MNKQSIAKLVEISQDCGYVGIGWEGTLNMTLILKNTAR